MEPTNALDRKGEPPASGSTLPSESGLLGELTAVGVRATLPMPLKNSVHATRIAVKLRAFQQHLSRLRPSIVVSVP
jgi:hypothetical protein